MKLFTLCHNSKFQTITLALVSLLTSMSVFAEGVFSLTSGIDYSSGKYGGTTATDVTYIPFTGKYEADNWIFKLTVPYISVTGPGNVIPNIGQIVNATNETRTDSGLGDVVASTSYSIINSAKIGAIVDVTGKIKFGTADKTKGLGSGADDYASEINLYKIYSRFSTFGTLGYKVFGQSLGYSLNNVYYGSMGFSDVIGEQTSAGLTFDYRQATSSTSDPQKMWTIFLNRKLSKQWKMQTYFFKGAGISSPDLGGGTMATKSF